MTVQIAYRLRPLAPFHLGTGRAGDLADLDDLPRSDTLAAALISVWHHLDRNADIGAMAAEPPFAVSSALPTIQDAAKQWIPLLPMPVGIAESAFSSPSEQRTVRRARFVEPSVLHALMDNRPPAGIQIVNTCLLSADAARQHDELWNLESRLRLAVNRLGDSPIPELLYDFGATHFDPNVRMTVVASFADPGIQQDFEASLQLLGDEGIGADRSAGYGRFEIESADTFVTSLGQGMRLTLSLLHPTDAEVTSGLLDEPARYELVTRGGWVTVPGARTLRKRNIRMLSEGSLIGDLGNVRYGDSPPVLEPIPNLGLHHSVHRPGIAVTLPIGRRAHKSQP